ncbi:MAG TPA: serine/threonine-protein kinase [Candidatus Polarisedimenticolaceae bacterium]|nr:serine/threonine-protein kinase [Candidatus Polarisedimenticolaceae bacterium]
MNSASPLVDDRFLVLDKLGQGGMAAVFRAFDRVEQRYVALKVHREAGAPGPSHPLAAEYDVWSRMRHRHVVRAYELAVAASGPFAPETPYLVLECASDTDPRPTASDAALPATEVERLGTQLLRAMHHVERTGWVHRDIKPGNILAVGQGARRVYKLTDFGLAVERGRREPIGRVSGSLPYVAPECLLGRALDARTDLYALGVTLFRLATGRLPAPATDPAALVGWHLWGAPADPRELLPAFPPRLARFVRRLTQRDPGERPAGAADALALLGATPSGHDRPPLPLDNATRAELRLALDAVRLGASREFRLDRRELPASELARQLRSWSHVFGLGFADLTTGIDPAVVLRRELLRLLIEMRDQAAPAIRLHRLDRAMGITCVAGQPVVDHSRRLERWAETEGIVSFLATRARRRGLVLVAAAPHAGCPLTARVVDRLRARLRGARPAPGCRGLLLVLTGVSETATARGSSDRAG